MARPPAATPITPRATLRLDKWLWHARFFRSRSIASEVVSEGHVRINGLRVRKMASAVGVGDVLTFVQGNRIRVVRILLLSERRGGAPDATLLYADLEGKAATPLPLE